MNPFGLRSAHVPGARSERTRRSKTPPDSLIAASQFNPTDPTQLMIALDVFGYAKFTQIVRGGYARAMQYEFLFIFQKGIRAGIEYRV